MRMHRLSQLCRLELHLFVLENGRWSAGEPGTDGIATSNIGNIDLSELEALQLFGNPLLSGTLPSELEAES